MPRHLTALRRSAAALARSWRVLAELDERRTLVDRPWEERFLHWAWDGREIVLHGELLPPRRRMSTTRGGWCRRAAGRPDPAPPPDRPRRP